MTENKFKIGFTPKGEYSNTNSYDVLDVVNYNNGTYASIIKENLNNLPTNSSSYWKALINPDNINSVISSCIAVTNAANVALADIDVVRESQSATFYYRYNIRKTYASIALMNADVASPIGTDGKYIKVGDIVTVVNSTTPSENGIYSYEGATNGWKYQSSFNFQLSQTTGSDENAVMSQKAVTDHYFASEVSSKYNFPITSFTSGLTESDISITKPSNDLLNIVVTKELFFYYRTQNSTNNFLRLLLPINLEIPLIPIGGVGPATAAVNIGIIFNPKTAKDVIGSRFSYIIIPSTSDQYPIDLEEGEVFAPIMIITNVAHTPVLSNGTLHGQIIGNRSEAVSNKKQTITDSETDYPSGKAVKTALDGKVNLTGDETIAGVKAFTSSPVVPDATLPQHPVTKGVFDSELSNINEKLYGIDYLDISFTYGFIGGAGVFVDRSVQKDYVISENIDLTLFKTIELNAALDGDLNAVFYDDQNNFIQYIVYEGRIITSSAVSSVSPLLSAAKSVRVWYAYNDTSTAQSQITIDLVTIGDMDVAKEDIALINTKIKTINTPQNGLVLQDRCKSLNNWNCAYKNTDGTYLDKTSELVLTNEGITIPYGTKIYTWNKNLIRVNPKVWILDFIPNGASVINIFTFGYNNGDNGVATDTPYIKIEITNSQLSIPRNKALLNYTFISDQIYRLKIYQEDKHLEVSMFELKTGIQSNVMVYNGTTDGNLGLMYDTLAIQADTASPIIVNYQIVSKSKKPFLSFYGDSISVGFSSSVVDGVNNTKFTWLTGNATGREFTSSGRGGGSYDTFFGGNCFDSKFNFTGMLTNELPILKPNYCMITIGTNGGLSYYHYEQIVKYIESIGSIPIINKLPLRDDSTIGAGYITSSNANIQQIWDNYGISGASFDLATSVNNDGVTFDSSLFGADKIHPNDAGHLAMFNRIKLDVPELF